MEDFTIVQPDGSVMLYKYEGPKGNTHVYSLHKDGIPQAEYVTFLEGSVEEEIVKLTTNLT